MEESTKIQSSRQVKRMSEMNYELRELIKSDENSRQ
jgi:hypothetical protein